MRATPLLVLAALLLGPAARGDDLPPPVPADDKRPAFQITIDRAKVDLPGHKLEAKLSRACDKVRIKVIGNSGAVLAEVEKSFSGAAAGTVLPMTWTPASEEDVAKIEVWGYDTEGFYVGIAIIPWKVSIPHEELNFETDSDVIRPGEVTKLEASLVKIKEVMSKHTDLGKITLFVVGHTDTVGTTEHNLALSRRRARAIAAWFRDHGLKSPIAFEGLGKSALLVKTGDQVDEPRNRRVDYILALEPPPLPSGEFSWKQP
jgi:outer membrane protein OmpA-like peptidoglycan-associated protein